MAWAIRECSSSGALKCVLISPAGFTLGCRDIKEAVTNFPCIVLMFRPKKGINCPVISGLGFGLNRILERETILMGKMLEGGQEGSVLRLSARMMEGVIQHAQKGFGFGNLGLKCWNGNEVNILVSPACSL